MTIRQKTEAEQHALDYITENWLSAKGRTDDAKEVLENAHETSMCMLMRLAQSSQFVAEFLRQEADRLRGERLGRKSA